MDPSAPGYYSRRFLYAFFSKPATILNLLLFLLLSIGVPVLYKFALAEPDASGYPALAGPAVALVQLVVTYVLYLKYRKIKQRESIPGLSTYPTRLLAEYHVIPNEPEMDTISEGSEFTESASMISPDLGEASASGYSSMGTLKESESTESTDSTSRGTRPKRVTRSTSTAVLPRRERHQSNQSYTFGDLLKPGTRLMKWFKMSKDHLWQMLYSKMPPKLLLDSPPRTPPPQRGSLPDFIALDDNPPRTDGVRQVEALLRRNIAFFPPPSPIESEGGSSSPEMQFGACGDPNKEWF